MSDPIQPREGRAPARPQVVLTLAHADNPLLPPLVDALARHDLGCVTCAQAAQAFIHLARRDVVNIVIAIILDAQPGLPVTALATAFRGLPGRSGLPLILVADQAITPVKAMVLPPSVSATELARWAAMPSDQWPQTPTQAATTPVTGEILDPQPLRAIDHASPGTGHKLAAILLADLPPFSQAIAQLLEGNDLTGLRRVAHKLAGSSGSLGAMQLHQACNALERVARNQDQAACAQAVPAALQAADRLYPILAAYIESPGRIEP